MDKTKDALEAVARDTEQLELARQVLFPPSHWPLLAALALPLAPFHPPCPPIGPCPQVAELQKAQADAEREALESGIDAGSVRAVFSEELAELLARQGEVLKMSDMVAAELGEDTSAQVPGGGHQRMPCQQHA